MDILRGTGGQIYTPITLSEYGISGKKRMVRFVVQADRTRGMSGRGDDLQIFAISQIDPAGFGVGETVHLLKSASEHLSDRYGPVPMRQYGNLGCMNIRGTMVFLNNFEKPSDMVIMTMRQTDGCKLPSVEDFFYLGKYIFGTLSGASIDQDRK